MKTAHTKTGMTLIELLVATAIVGIVMIGAVSIDYAVRQSRQSASRSGLLAMQVSAAMLQITRDGMLAAGNLNDPGVEFDDAGQFKNICFRQDADADPNSYTNDTWTCFSTDWDEDIIKRCDGLAAFLAADAVCPLAGSTTNLLTLSDAMNGVFFDVVLEGSGAIAYIEITLTSRADPSQGQHPITNPEYTLTSRISPPGISR